MNRFLAGFLIDSVRNCPFYRQDERIVLTERAVRLPVGRPSCLILVRAVTELLFQLMPAAGDDFADFRDQVFTCGGCTGLVKFRLSTPPAGFDDEGLDAMVSGTLEGLSPAELLQVFHMHQKTGRLLLDTVAGQARVTFREGAVIAARFGDLDNQEAIYGLLAQKKGCFRFVAGLPDSMTRAREIGDFMMILMEGLKRLDEDD